jgi:hypothetical protein
MFAGLNNRLLLFSLLLERERGRERERRKEKKY